MLLVKIFSPLMELLALTGCLTNQEATKEKTVYKEGICLLM